MISFQVLVIVLVYDDFCFHELGHFAFNHMQFYKEISNFKVVKII
jgi:hypothetical protein